MSQGEASGGSCCTKERAQDGFPTNLIIPHPSGHDTAAETHHLCLLLYKVCIPIPLPKIISETPQGNNWRTQHLQSSRPLWHQAAGQPREGELSLSRAQPGCLQGGWEGSPREEQSLKTASCTWKMSAQQVSVVRKRENLNVALNPLNSGERGREEGF